MFKILTISTVVLLLVGCSTEKNISAKSTMFQTVSEQEAVLVQNAKMKDSCGRCGMNLVKFYKTSHSATHDEKKYQYCSFHCLVDHLADGISLKNPSVVDINSLKFISIAKAHYVVGSKIRGTMTRVSKYAFVSENEAKKFQTDNGGEIMDFYKALDIVKKDFK